MNEFETLTKLYTHWRGGTEPARIVKLAGAGSSRRYYRLFGANEDSVIGVIGSDKAENQAFVRLAQICRGQVNVPEVLATDLDHDCYLQEDLGSRSLFDLLAAPEVETLVMKALEQLIAFQTIPVKEWESVVFCRPVGKRQLMWDLNYFKYEFLLPSGLAFDAELLEDDFERFVEDLDSGGVRGLMYRDFQSRNVMVRDGEPYLIDFQAAREGPVIYDAVSFLWQARAGFTSDFRRRMLRYYAEKYSEATGMDCNQLLGAAPLMALFRTLQVLGAYGLRGLVEQKAHFIKSIPGALANLQELLVQGVCDPYPELKRVAAGLSAHFAKPTSAEGRLRVEVFSFSYMKGYPRDWSGNGGGFMFDCRAMHNPGRYEQYKTLTGRDSAVIEFLEEKGEVQKFLASAWELADAAVARYCQRGFSNLQIGFGCTGGQHRSVYCAERTAAHLREKFPQAYIVLTHREQQ